MRSVGHTAGMTAVHAFGGRDLARTGRSWPGLDVDLVRWRAAEGTTGVTERADHLLFVTLSGGAGRTIATTDDGRYDGSDHPGAVTFVPARRRRRSYYGGGLTEYVALRLCPHEVASVLGSEPGRLEFRGFTHRPDPVIHALSTALRDELRSGGATGRLYGDSIAATLSVHLAHRYSNLVRPDRGRTQPLTGPALRRLLDYIDAHLGDDLRIRTLAEVARVSPRHISRAFVAGTGLPPHRYVTERRLERAARLLRAPGGPPIGEIAGQVGLSSQSHLTTAFRRRFGVTPLTYRREAAR